MGGAQLDNGCFIICLCCHATVNQIWSDHSHSPETFLTVKLFMNQNFAIDCCTFLIKNSTRFETKLKIEQQHLGLMRHLLSINPVVPNIFSLLPFKMSCLQIAHGQLNLYTLLYLYSRPKMWKYPVIYKQKHFLKINSFCYFVQQQRVSLHFHPNYHLTISQIFVQRIKQVIYKEKNRSPISSLLTWPWLFLTNYCISLDCLCLFNCILVYWFFKYLLMIFFFIVLCLPKKCCCPLTLFHCECNCVRMPSCVIHGE